jgi:hypothetical protein
MKTTIDMAREVKATAYTNRHYPDRTTYTFGPEQLKAFEAVVRADEREQALAAPTVQEPFGWWFTPNGEFLLPSEVEVDDPWSDARYEPMYKDTTLPAQPAFVPLTDDARGLLVIEHLGPNALLHMPMSIYDAFHMGIDAAESAHGITGENT